jgi:hypothetical protein
MIGAGLSFTCEISSLRSQLVLFLFSFFFRSLSLEFLGSVLCLS